MLRIILSSIWLLDVDMFVGVLIGETGRSNCAISLTFLGVIPEATADLVLDPVVVDPATEVMDGHSRGTRSF